jgi:hypothetical protein
MLRKRVSRSMWAVVGIVFACASLGGCGTQPDTPAAVPSPGSVRSGATVPRQAPQVGTAPQTATMSGSGPAPRRSSTVPVTGQPTATTGSASQTGPQLSVPAPATCTHPQYVTSAPLGIWNQAPYFVYNDMWDISGYQVSQTLYACSASDWYVVADMNNDDGDGHVKTYPNSHRDFDDNPVIGQQHSITSTFAESSPDAGIYEDAFDIELNYQQSDPVEVMIWTHNHGQAPGGTLQGSAAIGGRAYQEYKGENGDFTYIALVADQAFTSGTVDLLGIFTHLMQQGWIASNSTLHQVCFGAELVSTNGVPMTFSYSDFSVNISLYGTALSTCCDGSLPVWLSGCLGLTGHFVMAWPAGLLTVLPVARPSVRPWRWPGW